MGERTIIEFDYAGEFWPIFESWAMDKNFAIKEAGTNARLYKKKGLNNVFIKVVRSQNKVRLEMFAKNDFGVEMAIHTRALPLSQGWKKKFRNEANILLRALGQPPISIDQGNKPAKKNVGKSNKNSFAYQLGRVIRKIDQDIKNKS